MARRGDNGRTEERKEKKNLHCRSKRVQVRKWAQTQAVVSWVFSKGLRVFPVAFCCNAPGRKLTAQSESDTISYESSFFFFHELIRAWMDGEMLGDDLSKNYLHALAHSVRASQKSHWASCLSWSLTLTLGTNSWPLMSGQILQRPACSLRVN